MSTHNIGFYGELEKITPELGVKKKKIKTVFPLT